MIVSPSKIKANRIYKARTFNFETLKKTHGNMILVPTLDSQELVSVINSNLFKPSQLLSIYIPRIIKVPGRTPVRVDQSIYYEDMKTRTKGKIKIGKVTFNSYGKKNIIIDIGKEYATALDMIDGVKQGLGLQNFMREYFYGMLEELSKDPDYEKTYLIFPIDNYIESLKKTVISNVFNRESLNPAILFLRDIYKGKLDKNTFSRIDGIFFYNSNADAIIRLDLNDPDFEKDFPTTFLKIMRLNDYNNGSDSLDDIFDDDEIDQADLVDNTKEQIKEIVLRNVSASIKSNLTDFDAATKEEKELIISIEQKIDDYLKNPENVKKPFSELIDVINQDQDLKMRAVRYLEMKRGTIDKMNQLSKNLKNEVENIASLQDLVALEDEDLVTPRKFKVDLPYIDERIETSTLASIDAEYNKKQAKKDFANIISAFSNSDYLPLVLQSVNIEDTSDDFDEKETATIKYKTEDGKTLSFMIDIPKIVDERYFYLSGNKKIMDRQLIRLPIIKTKVDRVEITTSFNKMTIERTSGKISRKNAYLVKLLKETYGNPAFKIIYGSNAAVNGKREYQNDFEYEELADTVTSITTGKYDLLFNRDAIQPRIDAMDIPDNFITRERTPIGFIRNSQEEDKSLIFIEDSKIKYVSSATETVPSKVTESGVDLFTFIIHEVLKLNPDKLPSIGKSFMYTKVKFLGTTYPIFSIVGLTNGITDILRRYKVDHYLSDKKKTQVHDFVEVKFKDKYLYYKDTIKNSLLLSALYTMNPEEYLYSDFDTEKPYSDFFVNLLGPRVGLHTKNTMKINLGVMIDPITADVLKDLGKPTDITDLLLEANTMLTSSSYRPQNDLRNYRLRGTESLYVILYKILANAYTNYQKHKLNGKPISLEIPRGKLISEFMTQNIVGEFSFLNPTLEAEGLSWVSAKGPGGVNLIDAFTLEMRAYDESMVGIISGNATPVSGSAGVKRSLTYDPKITTTRGYIPELNVEDLSGTNMFSPSELLSPFTSTSADAARQGMQVSQSKHIMPTIKASKTLISSGLGKTLPFMISDAFCFKAKKDGKVERIDEENKIAILLYNDGTKDAIDLSATLAKNANSGFFIEQQFLIVYKENEKFEKGDVIAYNPNYFSGKGKNVSYKQGVLAKVAIASGDFAFEDATIISEKLSKKCTSYVVMETPVSLGPNAQIHKIMKIGDKVKTNDHLLDFTTSFKDKATSEFIQSLALQIDPEALEDITQEAKKSKYTGEIADIQVYYNVPLEELSPSLQKLIKQYNGKLEKRKSVIEGIKTASVKIPPMKQVTEDKIGNTNFDIDGGVIIRFFVKYESEMRDGDKLSYATALKGIVSNTLPEDKSPITEYRPEEVIEGIVTPTGIIRRMTADIYYMLYSNKVLVETGKQIKEIWEGKR